MLFSALRAAFATFAIGSLVFFPVSVCAQSVSATTAGGTGNISGTVVDQSTALSIPDATVTLYSGNQQVSKTASDSRGVFHFTNLAPAVYTLLATARDYSTSRTADVAVLTGHDVVANFVLSRVTSTAGGLRTIYSTTSTAGNAIASTTTITRTLDPTLVANENNLRFADQLRTIPGVNIAGLSSSVGDDIYLNIRGLGESETEALLDGHPVGPLGVYSINSPGGAYPGSFNFADSPYFELSKVQVTFGSGASGLYGVDSIGGTVDMETLSPTRAPHYEFTQGFGDQGKLVTAGIATGSLGRLGYALAGSTTGTYGEYPGQWIAQSGRPNNNSNLANGGACLPNPPPSPFTPSTGAPYNYTDLTSCNTALNTYNVGGQTELRGGLAKLTYALSNNTNVTGTWFASGQRSDSTGNGDNDNLPYDTRLAQVQAAQPGVDPSIQCALPSDTGGAKSGLVVAVDGNPSACYSPAQVAAASSGPFGGGENRHRGTNMFDYHGRFSTVDKRSTYTLDYFFNHYKYFKSSVNASGLNPDGTCCAGTAFTQFLNTQGYLFTDDIVNANSDIGFGYFSEHQLQTRLDYQFTGQNQFSWETPYYPSYGSVFVKGSFQINPVFSTYFNAWEKRASSDQKTSFDPRISFVVRPKSGHDVFRVTYGRSTGDPAAELIGNTVQVTGNPSSLNPTCTPYNTIGNGGNPGIKPEAANDYEFGYAHSFQRDSSVQLNLYQTEVSNQLFAADLPLTQYPGTVPIPPSLLAGFASKISSVCPNVNPANPSTVLPFLSISTTYNAARARYKGLEFTGRQRFTRQFYVDYAFDVQSARQFGVNDNILQNNAFIVNGGQIQGIPINQGSIGFDYSTIAGLEARIDGYFVGTNNVSQRDPYSLWNGFIGYQFTKNLAVRVGVYNMFNSAVSYYGYFGHQRFIPENQFYSDPNAIQEYLSTGSGEQFGLTPRAFLVSISSQL